jgi:hypothetical protein
MRRSNRMNWVWWRAKLLQTPGMAMAGIFIAASGMMSVTCGYRLGEPSGNALIFAAVALGVEAFADLSIPLFWHRLGLVGRSLLVSFFVVCLAYKLEAAKRFATENLGVRDAAIAKAAEGYEIALQRVETLRKTISDNADARPATLLQAEIDGLLRDARAENCEGKLNGPVTAKICPTVDRLRAELARSKARDQAQADLTPALAEWRAAAPAGGKGAVESQGPVQIALALAGVAVVSWSSLMAALMMGIVEGGAIVVPMLIGFASEGRCSTVQDPARKPTAPPEQTVNNVGSGDVHPEPQNVHPLTAKKGKDDADSLMDFLSECTDRRKGETVSAKQIFLVYQEWKSLRRETPVSLQRFGALIGRVAGVEKDRKAEGVIYLGLSLRHPEQRRVGRAYRNLHVVQG